MRRRQQPPPPPPEQPGSVAPGRAVDPYLGDEAARAAVAALAAGSWRELDELLDRDPTWNIGLVMEDEVPTAAVEAWAAAEPSARSVSALGAASIRDAWDIRGSSSASQVPESAWRGFHTKLQQAETVLRRAAATYRDAPEPWVFLLTTCKGLSYGLREMRARFAQQHQRAPFDAWACEAMVQGLAKKWGGSHEAMLEFARWVDQSAPPDSPARASLPTAHFERLFSGWGDGLETRSYLTTPSIAKEVVTSAERFLAALPPDTPRVVLRTLNAYVLTIVPIDRRSAELVVELYRRIGDGVTDYPWTIWDSDDIVGRFEWIRRERLEEAEQHL